MRLILKLVKRSPVLLVDLHPIFLPHWRTTSAISHPRTIREMWGWGRPCECLGEGAGLGEIKEAWEESRGDSQDVGFNPTFIKQRGKQRVPPPKKRFPWVPICKEINQDKGGCADKIKANCGCHPMAFPERVQNAKFAGA